MNTDAIYISVAIVSLVFLIIVPLRFSIYIFPVFWSATICLFLYFFSGFYTKLYNIDVDTYSKIHAPVFEEILKLIGCLIIIYFLYRLEKKGVLDKQTVFPACLTLFFLVGFNFGIFELFLKLDTANFPTNTASDHLTIMVFALINAVLPILIHISTCLIYFFGFMMAQNTPIAGSAGKLHFFALELLAFSGSITLHSMYNLLVNSGWGMVFIGQFMLFFIFILFIANKSIKS